MPPPPGGLLSSTYSVLVWQQAGLCWVIACSQDSWGQTCLFYPILGSPELLRSPQKRTSCPERVGQALDLPRHAAESRECPCPGLGRNRKQVIRRSSHILKVTLPWGEGSVGKKNVFLANTRIWVEGWGPCLNKLTGPSLNKQASKQTNYPNKPKGSPYIIALSVSTLKLKAREMNTRGKGLYH